jgi:hypothetical protein
MHFLRTKSTSGLHITARRLGIASANNNLGALSLVHVSFSIDDQRSGRVHRDVDRRLRLHLGDVFRQNPRRSRTFQLRPMSVLEPLGLDFGICQARVALILQGFAPTEYRGAQITSSGCLALCVQLSKHRFKG